MKRNLYIVALLFLLLASCGFNASPSRASNKTRKFEIDLDTITWFDSSRARQIPVAVYQPVTSKKINRQKVVIISHGYTFNRSGSYLHYSFIAEPLAAEGYLVVSIQHELPADSLLPLTGIPQIVRRSNWERGVQNIRFVIDKLKASYTHLDFSRVTLIGHSNGGDMSMLFAHLHPHLVDKVISLDNRRVAFPRVKHPQIYSIRSSDQPADPDVLPSPEEQKRYGIKIIKLDDMPHNNMGNAANEVQRKAINEFIQNALRE